jgi:hypothetical protein
MQAYKQECEKFISWCKPKLGIQGRVHVTLQNQDITQGSQKTFGYFDLKDKRIVVCCKDRHVWDVLRTICHEMVHQAQHEICDLTSEDGATGSEVENEANALAGILMRLYNQV